MCFHEETARQKLGKSFSSRGNKFFLSYLSSVTQLLLIIFIESLHDLIQKYFSLYSVLNIK